MKYRINNFRNLKCYERSLKLYKNIVDNDLYSYEDAQNISTGDGLYIKSVKEDLRKAINWSDYTIRFLSYEDRIEGIIIKKMICGLKRKMAEEQL